MELECKWVCKWKCIFILFVLQKSKMLGVEVGDRSGFRGA